MWRNEGEVCLHQKWNTQPSVIEHQSGARKGVDGCHQGSSEGRTCPWYRREMNSLNKMKVELKKDWIEVLNEEMKIKTVSSFHYVAVGPYDLFQHDWNHLSHVKLVLLWECIWPWDWFTAMSRIIVSGPGNEQQVDDCACRDQNQRWSWWLCLPSTKQ